MNRVVRFYNGNARDCTNGTIYPSVTTRFKPLNNQDVNPEGLIYDKYSSDANPWENEAYRYLNDRRNSFGRIVDLSRLKISPMYSDSDGFAMLLPIDNSVGKDYLTFNDPLWHTFLRELYRAYKAADCLEGLESLRTMVISYNLYAPFTVEMSKSGTSKIDKFWTADKIKIFSSELLKHLKANFCRSYETLAHGGPEADPLLPNVNVTHSTGFNQRHLDYTRLNKKDYQFVPKELYDSDTNLWAKYDLGPYKQECIDNGWVDNNLDTVLSTSYIKHCLADPIFFCQSILHQNCSIHITSYRTNNGDPSLNDQSEFDEWASGKKVDFYHKDRAMCQVLYDGKNLRYEYGTYDCKKLNKKLMAEAHVVDPLDTLKKKESISSSNSYFYTSICSSFPNASP